jgi:NAD(P)-dependent dehydrogenase (short-subunit alcohol dehydrogenase family)
VKAAKRTSTVTRSASLQGKKALVTGATRGIGLEIARALARERCSVFLTGRDVKALAKAESELGQVTSAAGAVCNVREPQSVDHLAEAVKKRSGRVDVLINNAGITQPSVPVADLSFEMWRDLIETNLTGLFLVTHAVLPLMRPGGMIVNVLSIAARQAFAGMSAYCASKYGALGFTSTLREELRGQGIRVTAILPGATDTELWETLWPEAPRQKMMSSKTVAGAVVEALKVPPDALLEELVIRPIAGTL